MLFGEGEEEESEGVTAEQRGWRGRDGDGER